MALSEPALKIVGKYSGKRVLSLGYPDILASPQWMTDNFKYEVHDTKEDGKLWHGRDHALPDAFEFFKSLGADLTCVDIRASRGCEKIVDLNYPQDLGKFDLVIDPGTLEHVFNISQGLMTSAQSVEVGGVIFHISPVSMVNHGFYNLCPTLLHDFYRQNGWEILESMAVKKDFTQPLPMTDRIGFTPECVMYFVARKTNDAALKIPVQTKYGGA